MAVEAMGVDCDADAIVYRVRPSGPACHTGERSCFFRAFGAGFVLRGLRLGLCPGSFLRLHPCLDFLAVLIDGRPRRGSVAARLRGRDDVVEPDPRQQRDPVPARRELQLSRPEARGSRLVDCRLRGVAPPVPAPPREGSPSRRPHDRAGSEMKVPA